MAALRPAADAQAQDGGPQVTDLQLEQWAVVQIWEADVTAALSFGLDELQRYAPGLSAEAVRAILGRFTLELGSLPEADYSSPLNHNPLADRPFLEWHGRYMLPVPGMIARDYVGLLERDLLKYEKGFSKWRAAAVDDLSVEFLAGMLPGADAYEHVFYPWAKGNEQTWPECDGLILYDSVAIIVEGKATPLSSAALRGDVRRARADLERSLAEAGRQADRVAEYLRSSDPAVFYDEHHREVVRVSTGQLDRIHVLLPTLHQLADYGMHPERLTALGLVHAGDAWSVYINDLRIIADAVKNPAEFLHYLKWRSRLPVGERIRVVDEIDLFGSYLLRQQFRELEQGPSTYVELTGSSTDFDDYYLGQIDHGPRAKKPELFSIPLVNRFLVRLARDKPPGWLDAAGVCIDLSLGELAFVGVRVPRLLQAASEGEALWERFETCLLVGLGPGTRWQKAWANFPGETDGVRRVIFADRKNKKPRVVWALGLDPEPDSARAIAVESSRAIFVIGPSSVGKSALVKRAHDALAIEVVDLDAEFKGAERDWAPIDRRLLELEKAGTAVLVDIGAGTQDRPELQAFLGERRAQLVLVWDEWQRAFARNVAAGHRVAGQEPEYLAWEIEGKQDLYGLVPANQRIECAGRDLDAGPADEFVTVVSAILGRR